VLHLLDESIEAFLRSEVPLPKRQVDVSFEAPDRDWGASVVKPTVNLYLWDIRLSADEQHAGMELIEDEDGNRHRRPPQPRVACRYLVTAWTSEVRDEHQLLGSVLTTFLGNGQIVPEFLAGPYEGIRPVPSIAVAGPEGRDNSDFWSALGGQLKPGLDLVLTATVDVKTLAEVGPPVERYRLMLTDDERSSEVSSVGGRLDDEEAEGRLVRSPSGSSKVDEKGHFAVRADSGDLVVVEGDDHRLEGKVPPKGEVKVRQPRVTKGKSK
jgi:Pvc16 N-terminal domain